MAACRSPSENTRKMNLIPVFNKNSTRIHTESELDVLGIPEKLVKYVVHLSKRKKWKIYFSSYKLPKLVSLFPIVPCLSSAWQAWDYFYVLSWPTFTTSTLYSTFMSSFTQNSLVFFMWTTSMFILSGFQVLIYQQEVLNSIGSYAAWAKKEPLSQRQWSLYPLPHCGDLELVSVPLLPYDVPSSSELDARLLELPLESLDDEVWADDSLSSKVVCPLLPLFSDAPMQVFAMDQVISANHPQPCIREYLISKLDNGRWNFSSYAREFPNSKTSKTTFL
jgi:hypothetical protein